MLYVVTGVSQCQGGNQWCYCSYLKSHHRQYGLFITFWGWSDYVKIWVSGLLTVIMKIFHLCPDISLTSRQVQAANSISISVWHEAYFPVTVKSVNIIFVITLAPIVTSLMACIVSESELTSFLFRSFMSRYCVCSLGSLSLFQTS